MNLPSTEQNALSLQTQFNVNQETVEGPVFIRQNFYVSVPEINTTSDYIISESAVQFSASHDVQTIHYQMELYLTRDVVLFSLAQPVSMVVRDSHADKIIFQQLFPVTFCANLNKEKESPLSKLLEELEWSFDAVTTLEELPFQLQFSNQNYLRVMFAPLYQCIYGKLTVTDESSQWTIPVSIMLPQNGDFGAQGVYYSKIYY